MNCCQWGEETVWATVGLFLCREPQMPAGRMGGPRPNQIPRKHLQHVPCTTSGHTTERGMERWGFWNAKEPHKVLHLSFPNPIVGGGGGHTAVVSLPQDEGSLDDCFKVTFCLFSKARHFFLYFVLPPFQLFHNLSMQRGGFGYRAHHFSAKTHSFSSAEPGACIKWDGTCCFGKTC